MDWRDRIVATPDTLVGKPRIKGTRISVELIVGWLANGWSFEQILESYPNIARDDILAALAFAAEMLREEEYVAVSGDAIKLLANENFPGPAIRLLRDRGVDVLWVSESMPGADDDDVLAHARAEGRWLLTYDRDYGELVFSRLMTPPRAVIYLRQEAYPPLHPGDVRARPFRCLRRNDDARSVRLQAWIGAWQRPGSCAVRPADGAAQRRRCGARFRCVLGVI